MKVGGNQPFNQPVMRQLCCASAQIRLRAGTCSHPSTAGFPRSTRQNDESQSLVES